MHVALPQQGHDPAYQAFCSAMDGWESSAVQPMAISRRVFSRSGQPGKCLHALQSEQASSWGVEPALHFLWRGLLLQYLKRETAASMNRL